MKNVLYLMKFALRNITRKYTYSISVITSVGVSVGALLCILTLSHLLLVQPLSYKDSDQLYVVTNQFLDANEKVKGEAYTYPGLLFLKDQQETFSASSSLFYSEDVIASEAHQPTVNNTYASSDWFSLLDIPMHLGRQFNEQEKLGTFNPNAIISYQAWGEHFNFDKDILDRNIDINGQTYSVIGVTSSVFSEPQLSERGRNTAVWLPWDFNPTGEEKRNNWSSINGSIFWVGRINSGYTQTQAQQILSPLINTRWQQEVSGKKFFSGWSINANVVPMKEYITGDSKDLVILLLVGVLGLVIITCVNIACLIMSRAAEQKKNMAIQASVGVKRHQLLLEKFVEVGLLMLFSTILAFVIAVIGFNLLQDQMSGVLPRVDELRLNAVTTISAVSIGLMLSLIFSYLSIGAINYNALASMLQSGGKGSGLQLSNRKQKVLIATQIAVASFLIFCNMALFIDSKRIIDTDTGFDVENVARIYVDENNKSDLSDAEIQSTMTEMRIALEAMPGVIGVSQSGSPLSRFSKMALTAVDTDESYTPLRKKVDHNYFSIINQTIVQGRNFTLEDIRNNARVMVVNDTMSNGFEDGLVNKRFSTGDGEPYTIIGVVKGISLPNSEPNISRVYTPNSLAANYFLVKLDPVMTLSREMIVSQIKALSPNYLLSDYSELEDTYRLTLFKQITTLTISAVLTLLVISLASLGIYGIVNNTVQQRRFELGTRVAIGAKKGQLVNLIIQHNLSPIVIGVIIQIIVLSGLYVFMNEEVMPFINMQLLGVFLANITIIIIIAFVACYLPMRQLFSKPPAFILRN